MFRCAPPPLRRHAIVFFVVFVRRPAAELRPISRNPFPSPPRAARHHRAATNSIAPPLRHEPDLRRHRFPGHRTSTVPPPQSYESPRHLNSGRRRPPCAAELRLCPRYKPSSPATYRRRRRKLNPPTCSSRRGGAQGVIAQRRRESDRRRRCAGGGGGEENSKKTGCAGGGRLDPTR